MKLLQVNLRSDPMFSADCIVRGKVAGHTESNIFLRTTAQDWSIFIPLCNLTIRQAEDSFFDVEETIYFIDHLKEGEKK
jgi:hypothetical protein